MKYRKLNPHAPYNPFSVRVHLRRQTSRQARRLCLVGCICLVLAGVLWARQVFLRGGQPASPLQAGSGTSAAPDDAVLPEAQVSDGVSLPGYAAAEDVVLPLYADLYAENADLIGWLQIDGTSIDFPVMQTPGENETYLRKGFDGLYATGGTPFLDERCSVTQPTANLIIYGHNMADGSMFAPLLQYREKSFADAHPTIRFDSIYEEGLWAVLAVVETDIDFNRPNAYYMFFDATDPDTWKSYYDAILADALYTTGKEVSYGDTLLTLSTCRYSYVTDRRLAVIAKRIPTPASTKKPAA